MLAHIIELSRLMQWGFGPVTCFAYPLDDLDTISRVFMTEDDDRLADLVPTPGPCSSCAFS